MLLAEIAGVAIGFAELSIRTDLPDLRGQRVGYIEGLYVRGEARRRGVARALLAEARRWAYASGCAAFASDREDRVTVDRSFGASGQLPG